MRNIRLVQQGVHIEPEEERQTHAVLRLRVCGSVAFYQASAGAGTAPLLYSFGETSQLSGGTSRGAPGFTDVLTLQFDPTAYSPVTEAAVPVGLARQIPILASEVRLDFGSGIPVTVTEAANQFMARLPWPALGRVLIALRNWAMHSPVKAARAFVAADPEDRTWREVVIELLIDADTEAALSLWDEMEKALASAKDGLPPDQRAKLDKHLAIHLLWGADSWHDDSAASV